MPTFQNDPVISTSNSSSTPAVQGEGSGFEGVRGISHDAHGGVVGINDAPGAGGNGGWFESTQGEGVRGWAKGRDHGGVVGVNTGGGIGVFGTSDDSAGVWGTSVNFEGIHAETQSSSTAAMASYQMNAASSTPAFFAKHMGNKSAGRFEGNVEVTGDVFLVNADCSEDFDISPEHVTEPGTVMVIVDEGLLEPSRQAYDRRVAGVISGAGPYRSAITLDKRESCDGRASLALVGKVYCKVDARHAPIKTGDLLTTSPTPGHAMKAHDATLAVGAVIGKALRPHNQGQGLIPILVTLQ